MRVHAGGRSAGAGSATLPVASLYAPANDALALVEVGVFNTTVTAVAVALRRLTTAGTQGAGLDELAANPDKTVVGTAFQTHTGAPTITAGQFVQASLGAAIGAGVIWTFGDGGLIIPKAITNGIGILVPTGTGQILDFYFVWDE